MDETRAFLLTTAAAFNAHPEPALTWDRPPAPEASGLRPGDDYNRRGSWRELLTAHGWTPMRGDGDGATLWRRPGKTGRCWSASTGNCRSEAGPLLYVFSTSAPPFESERSYSPFAAYTLLNHGGDYRAAARALAGQGYGEARAKDTASGGIPATPAAPPAEKVPPEPVLTRLSTVRPEPVPWLWQHWLPLGTLTILDGDPGLGKSTLGLDLAARVSRGWVMPPAGGGDGEPGGVILLSAEDSLKHTIRPRLDAARADNERVYHFDAVREGELLRPPVLPWDLELLEARIREWNVRLVMGDPLTAYIGSEFDAHKDQDIRRALRPLAQLAERLGVAMLFLRHLNKLNGGSALYRGTGSIAITGAARASWVVGRDPADEHLHVLAMQKTNLGPRPRSLAYRLEPVGEVTRIAWVGECDLRPDEILWHGRPPRGGNGEGPEEAGRPAARRGRPPEASAAAHQLLTDLLANGPVSADEVRRAAEAKGISWRTVQFARDDLEIVSFKQGASWFLRLPPKDERKNTRPGEGDGGEEVGPDDAQIVTPWDDRP